MITTIEQVYRARIEYDLSKGFVSAERWCEFQQKVEARAFLISTEMGLSCESNSGGPCWSPYITVEGSDELQVRAFVGHIEGYILRGKGTRIIA